MPITAEELDHLFTYHPPTADAKAHHDAIVAAAQETHRAFDAIFMAIPVMWTRNERVPPDAFTKIAAACRAFAGVIVEHSPPSADQSAAIRSLRLARMTANEVLTAGSVMYEREFAQHVLMNNARLELCRARWQASAAVALAQ